MHQSLIVNNNEPYICSLIYDLTYQPTKRPFAAPIFLPQLQNLDVLTTEDGDLDRLPSWYNAAVRMVQSRAAQPSLFSRLENFVFRVNLFAWYEEDEDEVEDEDENAYNPSSEPEPRYCTVPFGLHTIFHHHSNGGCTCVLCVTNTVPA
jgi:hypothetical protein